MHNVNAQTVRVTKDPSEASSDPPSPADYRELVGTYHRASIIPGKAQVEEYDNNTILIHLLGTTRYIYVGERVYSFDATHEEPIDRYYTYLGNSDVPYPVALSDTTFTYFMRDQKVVPRIDFPPDTDWLRSYSVFYDLSDHHVYPLMKNIQIIDSRGDEDSFPVQPSKPS